MSIGVFPLSLSAQVQLPPALLQDVRVLDQRGEPGVSSTAARPEYAREAEGGFVIVDDDLGLAEPEAPSGAAGGAHRFEPVAGGSWAGARRGPPVRGPGGGEEFPSLATAAAVSDGERGAVGAGGGGGQEGGAARRPPPLMKKTVKCPCGRCVACAHN